MKVKWVHCNAHGAPHRLKEDGSCWCSCIKEPPDFGRDGTPLETQSDDARDAGKECREKNLWLFNAAQPAINSRNYK